MKNTIQEVQDYFIGKICTGDYELISKNEHYALITIDKIYSFQMWMANSFEYLRTYTNSFMQLEIPATQRESSYNLLMTKIQTQFAELDRLEKLAQLEKLKKELGL